MKNFSTPEKEISGPVLSGLRGRVSFKKLPVIFLPTRSLKLKGYSVISTTNYFKNIDGNIG
jgi:hypothetical protein